MTKYIVVEVPEGWKGEDNCTNCIINTNDCFDKERCPLSHAVEAVEVKAVKTGDGDYHCRAVTGRAVKLYAVKVKEGNK